MKKKRTIWITLVLILVIAWVIRFVTFNRWVQDNFKTVTVRNYPVGELVPLGDNYLAKMSVNGYFLRVEGVRIVDAKIYYEEVLGKDVFAPESWEEPYKICEITLYIKNENNLEEGLRLFSMDLQGRDFFARMNPELFAASNSGNTEEELSVGVKLLPGQDTTVKVPFDCITYVEKMGRVLETEPLWLLAARYPEEIRVQVQP